MVEGGVDVSGLKPRRTVPGLVLLGYPYTPRRHTGRGIDEYLFHLTASYSRRKIPFLLLENGRFPDHVRQLFLGEPQMLSRVAHRPGGFWHAVSPVGARFAVMVGRHPLVTTVHDIMPFYMLSRHPARYRFLRFCIELACRSSDRIIVPFPSVRQFLVERLAVPEEKIALVPYGVDASEITLDASVEPSSAADRGDTVLFFGSWNPIDRGGDIAVKAMVRVVKERPRARLLLSCTGPETETLRQLARRLGVESSVTFPGFVPAERLAETFRLASAVVFASRLSFNLLEMKAMYAGVPVVVTDVRDQSHFVGDAGLILPPEDPEAMGAELVRLLGDASLQASLIERGRRRVREFSLERMAEGTLRAYADIGWTPPEE